MLPSDRETTSWHVMFRSVFNYIIFKSFCYLCHHLLSFVHSGLLSFGMGCHKSTLDKSDDGHVSFSTPGFFSSVCEYIPWIEATIKQHKGMCSLVVVIAA